MQDVYNKIKKIVKNYEYLFENFESVYLFGTSLYKNKFNDIDILFVYNKINNEIISVSKEITDIIENKFTINVDKTLLSKKENDQINFISKLKDKYAVIWNNHNL